MARYRRFNRITKKNQVFSSLRYQFLEVIKNINSYKFVNFSSLVSIVVIFLILGGFLLFMVNINKFIADLSSKASMVVYLKKSLNKGVLEDLIKKIKVIKGVKEIKYVSNQEALEELKESFGKEVSVFKVLSKNPLPDSLNLKLENIGKRNLKDNKHIAKISALISEIPGVDEVDYGYKIFDLILKTIKIIKITFIGIMFILSFFTILLLTNTLKLTLIARRDEFGVMKLIGATNWYIRLPFLVEGIILSSLGCILSLVLLWFLFNIILTRSEIYLLISQILVFLSWKHCLGMMALSLFFGFVSSYMASFSIIKQR
ncbi:permease-like cell division protein FtsX [bacterium]|nr:permease-like cell division protein FtsX [bacterium]MBU1152917.1 permease-like cell division protein FtsX [bacterium]MBU1782683.1 permease-like cell division protein FtsX [bacterium]